MNIVGTNLQFSIIITQTISVRYIYMRAATLINTLLVRFIDQCNTNYDTMRKNTNKKTGPSLTIITTNVSFVALNYVHE